MLRTSLIASLVLLNLSVWIGPAEVLAARGKALFDPTPQYERAQQLLLDGNVKAAADEYSALLNAFPENVAYRTEYALLCLNNADVFRDDMGWSQSRLATTTQEQMLRARVLGPDNFRTAAHYAFSLMDEEFFGTEIPRETVVESWEKVLTHVNADYKIDGDRPSFIARASNAYLQLARLAYRYGDKEGVRRNLEQVQSLNPETRIPAELLEHN